MTSYQYPLLEKFFFHFYIFLQGKRNSYLTLEYERSKINEN